MSKVTDSTRLVPSAGLRRVEQQMELQAMIAAATEVGNPRESTSAEDPWDKLKTVATLVSASTPILVVLLGVLLASASDRITNAIAEAQLNLNRDQLSVTEAQAMRDIIRDLLATDKFEDARLYGKMITIFGSASVKPLILMLAVCRT